MTAIIEPVPSHETTSAESPRTWLSQLADRPWETAVAALIAAFVVFAYPQATLSSWTPSIAWTWFVAPLACIALVWRAWLRDRAARIAAGLAVWSVVTSALSEAPINSLIGSISRFNSALVFVTGLGCWALASSLSPAGRRGLCWAVVAASGVSAMVGVLQMIAKPTSGFLAYAFDRPNGLATNPVYLAAHVGAGAAFFAYRFARDQRWWDLAGLGTFSLFTALTGSRVALASVVVVGAASIVMARTTKSALSLPTILGATILAQQFHALTGSGGSAADRANLNELGLRIRLWEFGLRAWLDSPITGHGLGRYRGASQRYYTDDWVRFTEGDDATFAFIDSHSLVVQLLVSLGIVGLVLLVAFLIAAGWRAAGPGIWMAAVFFATWMMQPPVAQTWPVGLALLGTSSAAVVTAPVGRSGLRRVVVTVALVFGAFLGGSMVVADQRIDSVADGQRMELPASMWILGRDPVLASSMAGGGFDPTKDDPGPADYVLTWSTRAAEYDADFPLWWAQLGLRRLRYADVAGAREAAERGVELQPNHIASWQVLRIVADRTDDADLGARADEMLCRFDLGPCAGQAASG